MTWGTFKPLLADAVMSTPTLLLLSLLYPTSYSYSLPPLLTHTLQVVAHIEPIQTKYNQVMKDEAYLNQILAEGQDAADTVAEQTLKWAKEAMGFHIRAV